MLYIYIYHVEFFESTKMAISFSALTVLDAKAYSDHQKGKFCRSYLCVYLLH